MSHRLSAVLMAAAFFPIPWVYGGSEGQVGALTGSVLSSVRRGVDLAVVREKPEMAILDASQPPWTEDDRQQTRDLVAGLKRHGITIRPTFYRMLSMATPEQRSKLISHCRVFFDHVDRQEIGSTACLTSMIQRKTHIGAFLLHGDDSVRRVASTPALRSLTSLFNNRGFPELNDDTQAFINWKVWWRWKGDGRTLDRKLLRIFSSMFSSKGLPDKKVVEEYLQWEIWWQGEGEARTLDRRLLHTFSSMFSGRGLPDKKAVQDYLQLDIWWQGEGGGRTLDRELLQAISLMFHGRGLPNKKAVDDYLQLDIWWQGEGNKRILNRELLRAVASVCNGKGLPDKSCTENIVQWLTCNEGYSKQGVPVLKNLDAVGYVGHQPLSLPDNNKLSQAEQKLTALIYPGGCDQDEQNDTLPLIRKVALYLANDGGTQQLSWIDCKAWLREYPDTFSTLSLLRQLLLILDYQGGQGIKEAVAMIAGQPTGTKWFVLDALGSGQALASVRYALQAIEPSEWWEYLSFTRELQPLPSVQQWQTIKGYLQALAPALPHQEHQRRFLNLIWPLPTEDQQRFVQPEAVGRLITFFPSAQVMGNLLMFLTTDELRTLFDTCLMYREGLPDKQGLPTLFKALLFTPLLLLERAFECEVIPEGLLARADDQPEGVVIGGNPAIGVDDPVTLFIGVMAALMKGIRAVAYTIDGRTLTLFPHGGATDLVILPMPSLDWHPDGVQIRHWTLAHLHHFYQATECCQTPGCY